MPYVLLLNGPARMKANLETLANELAKARPDRGFLLHQAFDFAEELAHCDPVLRFWVASVTTGIEIAGPPRREILEEMVRRLDERYQRATTELGMAKESQACRERSRTVRELLQRFAGQEVDGNLSICDE